MSITKEESYTPTLNIIDFVESLFGLSFSKSYGDNGLYPVQKFVLKLMFGLPLDDQNHTIKIPIWWQKSQSNRKWDYHRLTEEDYLQYLLDDGRVSLPSEKGSASVTALVMGRQSGTSTLLNFCALYNVYCHLENPHPWQDQGLELDSLLEVGVLDPTLDMSTHRSSQLEEFLDECDFLKNRKTNSTRLTTYFDRPFKDEKGKNKVRLSAHHLKDSNTIRGRTCTHLYLDNSDHIEDDMVQEILPSITDSFVFSTYQPVLETPFHEAFEEVSNEPSGLSLRIPSWELNPTISSDILRKRRDSLGKEVFECHYGAKFIESRFL